MKTEGNSACDVLVLGGGFAGLSCATALAQSGARVVLLEKKPHLGGRAYSFREPKTGATIDNGQHLLMGCYRQTRVLLRRIGSESLLHFPTKVRVDYADSSGARDTLRCPDWLPAPLNLAAGIFGLQQVSLREKAAILRLDRAMKRLRKNGALAALDGMTVRSWLSSLQQPKRLQERVFDPIALGALNDLPERASALGFVQVLREIFYRDNDGAKLGLSTVDLSALYVEQSRRFIESREGRVLLSQKAVEMAGDGEAIREVVTEAGERFAAENVVSTLPPWSLRGVRRPPQLDGAWTSWQATPIIGINLWLDRPLIDEPLVGMLGTEIHWVFNKTLLWKTTPDKGQYLSLVVSGAHRHIRKSPEDLLELATRDLSACFRGFQKSSIRDWYVVKEPFATPSPICGSDSWRPGYASPLRNFYYAGDWTQTGLPATIESAVVSGHACAELILHGRSSVKSAIISK